MRIADVSAFYTPTGGGVRTYVDAKLRAAERFGHEIIMIVPGERHDVQKRGPNGAIVSIPSPLLPVDRRYRYFDDEAAIHAALDEWQPDHVEASSPWSSAAMVGRWQGWASRSLVMHADPFAAYAYRWLGGFLPRSVIDGIFGWYWSHLRGLGRMFDSVICANAQLAQRLTDGGVENVETIRMGVEGGLFSPALRSAVMREQVLCALGLDAGATLLVAIGRFSAEKRWHMVLRAVGSAARQHNVGLLLIGDGPKRAKLELLADRTRTAMVLPHMDDREELARLLASADALVHGCEAETFCMVAAEARASGTPLIVPDRGAAVDQLAPGAGTVYRAASEVSLERAIVRFIKRGPELQRAVAVRSRVVRTMEEHFADLFTRYAELAPYQSVREAGSDLVADTAGDLPLPRPAVLGS